MTCTHQDFAKFLESLKVKNEGPKEWNGYKFSTPLFQIENVFWNYGIDSADKYEDLIEYLLERLRRAESSAKPETLAEDVKAYMRAGMHIAQVFEEYGVGYQGERRMKTLQEALTLVPTHWPLVPRVDKWKKVDEYCLTEAVKLAKAGWQKIGDGAVGLELPTKDCETRGGWFIVETVIGIGVRIASDYIARRPIPQSVRQAEAYRYLMDGDLHPKHSTPIINAISNEGLKLARKHKHPLLSWVEENRK